MFFLCLFSFFSCCQNRFMCDGTEFSLKFSNQNSFNEIKTNQKLNIFTKVEGKLEKQVGNRPKLTEIPLQSQNIDSLTKDFSKSNSNQFSNLNKQKENSQKSNNHNDSKHNNENSSLIGQKISNKEFDNSENLTFPMENQTEINSTTTEKPDYFSIYNDLVNSEYYIYILLTIIFLTAIIFTYVISHCCMRIQKCIEENEQEQAQTTDESDLGLIPLN